MYFSPAEKLKMTEADIRSKFIMPAILNSGWSQTQIREEYYFTAGRYSFEDGNGKKPKRKKGNKADYMLFYRPNFKLAIVEAKDNKKGVRAGLQQAIDYARELLDVPFVYSSNGDGFIEYDFITGVERKIRLDQFPSPDELYQRWIEEKAFTPEQLKVIQTPYYTYTHNPIEPRYYQEAAINKTIEAVARGQQRILLVMATGTGKTYTAFQIIHRLKASGAKRKILFLADRNVLVDQPMREDFKPFGSKMTKISHKNLDSAYEIYLALYQQLDGAGDMDLFKQFQPSFFDLIVIDECHRGSSKEDSNWREILDYFKDATHIGMTATPKETVDASNISYFGEPIYTYSLRQGIEDGFLAPYRVVRINLSCDLGWRPPKGFKDINGNEVEDRLYTVKDFDRTLISLERTEMVAQRITEYLKQTDRNTKTIVFCCNIAHAERMCSALAKFNADMLQQNPRYIRQITGEQSGKQADLESFCDVIPTEKHYPVIAVTSKLMTTGVNSQSCKLIVLDANIGSMTEFKQIIGRGTRLRTEVDKTFFTIMDFRDVTNLFADPTFDGDPTVVIDIPGDKPIDKDPTDQPLPKGKPDSDGDDVIAEPRKVYVIDHGIGAEILRELEQYLNEQGELVTSSFNTVSQQVVKQKFQNFEVFRKSWNNTAEQFSPKWIEKLREVNHISKEIDDADAIAKVIYNQPTKQERLALLQQNGYFDQFSPEKQKILNLILDEHLKTNIDLTKTQILTNPNFNQFGGAMSVIKTYFGDKSDYQKTVAELENQFYINY